MSLRTFLRDSERSLDDLYRSRDRTWTRHRRNAGLPVAAGDEHHEALVRAIHRLLHIDDADRVETYRRFLTAEHKPAQLNGPTGRRYRRQREAGTAVLLFVRESPTLPNGAAAPFTLLGPATFVEDRGERPIQITWKLQTPMPESLLEVARLVAA